ncbi:hypothetical protein A3K29_04695 [Candidatus Collierbacteria bacterium RIFOXYB2_FULL_46_14]|uniref:ADP-ribose pyrophosphatase n=1 Tax=Candidatus Collierbacteria bacterium GW2011_GWA2_46_26 TaxID=1618381 RepID=A0A0G1SIJ5_9BACT|nr:MAG: Nucleoside diphosphate pyrophosphatase [Candidatus Collierbacteria bacterium GW2011_GWC2_44_13]KKU33125.1 MAG: Nucleoside diphosphate pyrophosphatase [Candidatus Collierbacteria bacterium GW2011_GWA2_46_26]OGD73397.1 MAG: hypothetical protein A3K29_04695 [Candidatus Collierbacteria bacterium RIFOXYB2_FULL_46_14]OGD76439.1 MAG: hypothetical protein A3K43_04695 [Candidatus Collierbacteria bacterium RIFOXYA2_FULL_46_20]OGD77775.1 MAG: hypothetical protein A3K39_04695 [Candidatus Collierbac
MKKSIALRKPTTLIVYELADILVGSAGPLKFLKRHIRHEGFDGKEVTYPFDWGVLERGYSVAVLIHDPVVDKIALVEQFRPAIKGTIFELVAGTLTPGEDPIACLKHEIFEEAALTVKLGQFQLISSVYLSPGGTSEKMWVYYTTVSGLGDDGALSGLVNEGECTKKHIIPVEEAFEMVRLGIICDAKTVLALLWLKDQSKK